MSEKSAVDFVVTTLVAVEVSPGRLDVFLSKGDGDIRPWRTVRLTLTGRASPPKTPLFSFCPTIVLKRELWSGRRTGLKPVSFSGA